MIVLVGSRKHPKYHTLNNALSPRVTQLALGAINSRGKPLEVIKAFILLLTWPVTTSSFYRNPSFVLSGALIHMALQCGLHTSHLKIFSVKTKPALSELKVLNKAQLWAYVAITYQRKCAFSGHAALLLDTYNEQESLNNIADQFPES
jgi:transcriptional regulatory protein LEU3